MLQVVNKIEPEQFIYWLKGFLDLSNATSINETQLNMIKQHLRFVVADTITTQTTTITGTGSATSTPKPPGRIC